MSVQTCLPTGCKPRHPISQVAKTPSFLRHNSNRQNHSLTKTKSANRRSAVERLEESKANYVKSERVLDSKQEFKHSSHLHVSNGPHLDVLLKATSKAEPTIPTLKPHIHDPNVPLSIVPTPELVIPMVSKSPTRTRAKSHSEGYDPPKIRRNLSFASHENNRRIRTLVDIESQLKLLLSSNSKENVSDLHNEYVFTNPAQGIIKAQNVPPEIPKVRRGYSDPTHPSCFDEPDSQNPYSIYKSMPNLSPPSRFMQSKHVFIESENDYTSNHSAAYSNVSRTSLSPRHILPSKEESPPLNTSRRFSNGTGTLHLTPYIPQTPTHYQRHAVSRSKSDVSHRCLKRNSEYMPKKNNYTSAEVERFFDTMGLDATAWQHISSPASDCSPPCFFQSISSIDSNDRSSNSSDESLPPISKEGLRNYDLRGHGPVETSIVEKNARVIKWLYNCKKAGQSS